MRCIANTCPPLLLLLPLPAPQFQRPRFRRSSTRATLKQRTPVAAVAVAGRSSRRAAAALRVRWVPSTVRSTARQRLHCRAASPRRPTTPPTTSSANCKINWRSKAFRRRVGRGDRAAAVIPAFSLPPPVRLCSRRPAIRSQRRMCPSTIWRRRRTSRRPLASQPPQPAPVRSSPLCPG